VSASLELVRSIVAAWERADFSSAEWADPQIEFVIADGVEPGSWHGMTAMANAWRSRLSVWEGVAIQAEEYREIDGERVLVHFRGRGRGKTSGLDLEQLRTSGAMLFEIERGKVARLVVYNDAKSAPTRFD